MTSLDKQSPETYAYGMNKACNIGSYLLALMIGIMGTSSFAQQTPQIGDALRQSTPPFHQEKKPLNIPKIGPLKPLNIPEKENSQTILVKEFLFKGNDAIETSTLKKLVQDSEGKNLTLNDLDFTTSLVGEYYRSQGFFLARAILPPQDIIDGKVIIQVIEGRAGNISVNNTSYLKNGLVEKILGNIEKNKALNETSIERALLTLNNLPGTTITKADLSVGKNPGDSDLTVSVDKEKRIDGYAVADNYGSSFTGKKRLQAGINFNEPFGTGDKLFLGGIVTQGQYLKNYRADYSTLLHPSGLMGKISTSRTSYQLTDSFKNLNAAGTANVYEGELSYPVIRTRGLSTFAGINFSHKDLKDEIKSTNTRVPKSVDSITPSVSFDFENSLFGFSGQTNLGASMTIGTLNIKDSASAALDKAGAKTEGTFTKSNFYANHLILFNNQWSAAVSLRGQKAFGKNLDGTEDMSISGLNGVVVYPPDEFAAENGYFGRAELLYTAPIAQPVILRMGPFVESGYAQVENKIGTNSSKTLSDIGLGAYANYNQYFANLTLATATTASAKSDNVPNTRLYFQTGIKF